MSLGQVEELCGDVTKWRTTPNVCIVQQCNCVTMLPHGLSRTLTDAFSGYTNSYGRRRHLTRNTSTIDSRPEPGTVELCECEGKPLVANIFGQFMLGKNTGRQMSPLPHDDDHMRRGKAADTSKNRQLFFTKGL
ncbi:hypothetical protein Pcinc_000593 [Petrolisthes cinctipes]|uniref:Uncharacterized protein n=1 Tax=Petrolisthes cinctipes TaxID=88211 RepID=A0AAE1GPC4_PETCI|nr:hypothetical protein Pcinc_000593 [Petrolisthes cinctipes]